MAAKLIGLAIVWVICGLIDANAPLSRGARLALRVSVRLGAIVWLLYAFASVIPVP